MAKNQFFGSNKQIWILVPNPFSIHEQFVLHCMPLWKMLQMSGWPLQIDYFSWSYGQKLIFGPNAQIWNFGPRLLWLYQFKKIRFLLKCPFKYTSNEPLTNLNWWLYVKLWLKMLYSLRSKSFCPKGPKFID